MERTGRRSGVSHAGTSRVASRRLAAAGLVLFAATLVLPANRAIASRPARTGWWQAANQGPLQAPAPPDVPSGGLYVQGGQSADQPAAVSAVGFDLPDGSGAGALKLHLATPADAPASPSGTVPPPPSLKACLITAGTFSSEENGPAADIPPYDCTGGADGVAGDGGVVTFAVGSLARAGILAVAIVPVSPTDRASFAPPGDDALTVVELDSADSSETSTAPDTSSADLYGGLYPDFSAGAGSPDQGVTGALVTPPTTAPRHANFSPRALGRPITVIKPDIYSKTGQLLAIGLLLTALVAYIRGYGLLGGRVVET